MQNGDYDDLRSAVESAGFASDIHPNPSGGVHAVVATHRGDGFLFGNSFRIAFRDGRWYLFTWTPNFYLLPANADPCEVCIACLRSGTKTISQFPSALVERYGLEWISPEAYDLTCGHDSARETQRVCDDIDLFRPSEENWLPLEALLDELFASDRPSDGVPAMLRLLERFPEEDGAGVLWSVVHGLESLEGYEPRLVRSVSQTPSHLGVVLVGRLIRSGATCVDSVDLRDLLRCIATGEGVPLVVQKAAQGFLTSPIG